MSTTNKKTESWVGELADNFLVDVLNDCKKLIDEAHAAAIKAISGETRIYKKDDIKVCVVSVSFYV